jgi:hypothetical protein
LFGGFGAMPSTMPAFLTLDEPALAHDTLMECHSPFSFNPRNLAAAISKGYSKNEIRDFLQRQDRRQVESCISQNIDGRHSALFYAARKNAIDIMELLLEYGADPGARDPTDIPLLAVMIMWTKWTYKNVDKSVTLLLSYGANPHCVSDYMWSNYIKMPTERYSKDTPVNATANWVKKEHCDILEDTLNLTIRYHLNRASLIKPVTKRKRQLARLLGCPRILHLPFHENASVELT